MLACKVEGIADERTPAFATIANLHETIHWQQAIGTTIGAFLVLSKATRDLSIGQLFGQLDQKQRSHVISARHKKNGVPFVPIDKKNYSLPFLKNCDPNLDSVRQVVYDLWLTHTLMFSSLEGLMCYKSLNEIVSLSLRDISHRYSLFTGNPGSSDEYQLEGQFAFVGNSKNRLTTYALFEGSALANELGSRLLSGEPVANLLKRCSLLEGSCYVLAFKMIANRLGIELEDGFRSTSFLLTVALVIDLSLNPSIPPYVLSPSNGAWEWDQIYPPARFSKIIASKALNFIFAEISAKAEALVEEVAPTGVKNVMIEAAEIAKVGFVESDLRPTLGSNFFDAIPSTGALFGAHTSLEEFIAGDPFYYDFVFYASGLAATHRRNISYLDIAVPGMSRRTRHYYSKKGIASIQVSVEEAWWMNPPLLVPGNKDLAQTMHYSESFTTWFGLTAALHYPLYDFAFRMGSLDIRDLPRNIVGSRIYEISLESFFSKIGAYDSPLRSFCLLPR